MMSLPVPTLDAVAVYEKARDRFADFAYKKRLVDGQATVLALGSDYISKGTSGQLHLIVADGAVPPHIWEGDMKRLYSEGLLRKNSDARTYYEKLRLSSPFRVCPFCLHRPVRTLDHYLPKTNYGAYAVLPANLIPCCRDCNSEKDEFSPQERASTLLHPYFDRIDQSSWLGCEIDKHQGYCTASFYIRSADVSEELRPRLIAHMDTLQLWELYEIEAAREINEMAGTIKSTFVASGSDGVQMLCEEMGASRSVLAENYWKAVLWRSAAQDEEFCKLGWQAVD